jgi:CheY-like chemotaxis protein
VTAGCNLTYFNLDAVAAGSFGANPVFFIFARMLLYQSLLLIDDDVDDHEIFISALETVSPEVSLTTAVNGADALKILLEQNLYPELIFLDINMPLMNGLEFLTELRKHDNLKHIPVIAYTTTSAPETIEEAKQLGATGFISKPENFSDLEKILAETPYKQPGHNF